MSIHHKRREKAEKLILELQGEQKLPGDITAALVEAGYTADELKEIASGAYAPADTVDPPTQDPPEQDPPAEEEAVINKVKTDIIPDNPKAERSTRKGAPTGTANNSETVQIFNNQTGRTYSLPRKGAERLVRQESDKYKIVK